MAYTPTQTRRVHATVEDGRITPLGGVEVIVSDHCNIACRQCNHASPIMPKWNADPDEIARDAKSLAGILTPDFVKVLGGEPLLNPRLGEILAKLRGTGLSDHHALVTNGILFDRMTDEIWSNIDEVEVSNYPAAKLSEAKIADWRSTAAAHGVKFTHNLFADFRRTFTSMTCQNDDLVADVFKACKIVHVWGSHCLYKGRLYRCPQSVYAPSLSGRNVQEGVALSDRAGLRDEVLAMLNDPTPLESCKNCVGTSGLKQPHTVLPRRDWAEDAARPMEDNIDYALMAENQIILKALDDCKVHESHANPSPLRRLAERLGYAPGRVRRSTVLRADD